MHDKKKKFIHETMKWLTFQFNRCKYKIVCVIKYVLFGRVYIMSLKRTCMCKKRKNNKIKKANDFILIASIIA